MQKGFPETGRKRIEENERSIDQGRIAAKNTGLKYSLLSTGIDVVAPNTFSVSVSACRRGSHETPSNTPLPYSPSPLPHRNANSAIEFSGILPDDRARGIKFHRDTLSIHARPSFPTDPHRALVSILPKRISRKEVVTWALRSGEPRAAAAAAATTQNSRRFQKGGWGEGRGKFEKVESERRGWKVVDTRRGKRKERGEWAMKPCDDGPEGTGKREFLPPFLSLPHALKLWSPEFSL